MTAWQALRPAARGAVLAEARLQLAAALHGELLAAFASAGGGSDAFDLPTDPTPAAAADILAR
ncbi:MAG: hypothetical protein KF699_17015 [Phycisphaeraceae bacterium]|nr:hypothetical protein [Phycisphaeraceae bacterium]